MFFGLWRVDQLPASSLIKAAAAYVNMYFVVCIKIIIITLINNEKQKSIARWHLNHKD